MPRPDKQTTTDKTAALRNLQQIPGVGKAVSEDLWNLGYTSVESLNGLDPEKMYHDLCLMQQTQVDRCMLYVFRCAVYYASNETYDSELLKWWNWKDTAS